MTKNFAEVFQDIFCICGMDTGNTNCRDLLLTVTISKASMPLVELKMSQYTSARCSRVSACNWMDDAASGVIEEHLASSRACSCAIDLHERCTRITQSISNRGLNGMQCSPLT